MHMVLIYIPGISRGIQVDDVLWNIQRVCLSILLHRGFRSGGPGPAHSGQRDQRKVVPLQHSGTIRRLQIAPLGRRVQLINGNEIDRIL